METIDLLEESFMGLLAYVMSVVALCISNTRETGRVTNVGWDIGAYTADKQTDGEHQGRWADRGTGSGKKEEGGKEGMDGWQ